MEIKNINEIPDLFVFSIIDLVRSYENFAKNAGLSLITLATLEIICKQKECTQKDISSLLGTPKQNINQIIKSLYQDGYVELKEKENDRRNKQVCLTEKGREFAKKIMTPLWRADELTIKKLGSKKSEQLITLLDEYKSAYAESVKEVIEEEKK